ncbi:MAG: right-handed parallel beta-helix repeat-containing protein [Planctomycetes bacterium]|nr:right-handed parallel beta-helix repeat-containing protein [Planctomycetota bacterium]
MRFLCIVAVFVFACGLAAQNQFNVSNLNDSGAGSLRQAILDANATPNQMVSMVPVADEIRFQAGVTGTITLASALPVITEGVSIIGPGRALLTISGASLYRVFESQLGHYLGLSGMTVTNGRVDSDGGGLLSRGLTVIFDVSFVGCQANGPNSGGGPGGIGRGGAIFHSPLVAALSVTNCLFQNCSASGGSGATAGGNGIGGAVYAAFGSAAFLQVTFNQCMASGGTGSGSTGGFARGGAISSDVDLTLTDCVLDGCQALGGGSTAAFPSGQALAGAVFASRNLTLSNTTLTACSAVGAGSSGATGTGGDGSGGAICYNGGTGQVATLTKVAITGCAALRGAANGGTAGVSQGGAIAAYGALTLVESEISACDSDNRDRAGGIRFESAENLSVQRSTIAGCLGTGLQIINSASATIINSTISGNNGGAGTGTGGIESSGAIVQLTFSTVTANTAAIYGGVYKITGTLTVVGCVVAGNFGSGGSQDLDANGSMSIQNSVVGIQDPDAIAVSGSNGNQVGSAGTPLNAMLAGLTSNGGPTRTHALLAGSPAINTGGSTGAPTTDQRNAPRNQGLPDAGSYEFGATPPNTGGTAGGKGDDRCSTGEPGGTPWLLLAALLAALGLGLRRVRSQ